MNSYEVVIIGAGPAGTTAASILARNGVETLLIDKNEFPRSKVCGGAISERTVKFNRRALNLDPLCFQKSSIFHSHTNRYTVFFQNRKITSIESEDTIFFTNRKKYDHYLLKKAKENGVDTTLGDKVNQLSPDRNALRTESGRSIKYDALFAADGANSFTRKFLRNERSFSCPDWTEGLAVGIETLIPRTELNSSLSKLKSIEICIGVVNWGYGWVFPHKNNLLIGLGGLQTKNDNFRSLLMNYGNYLNIDLKSRELRGHPFPLGNYLERPFHENILLLGDAAGFADPLNGEGIFYAQRSGELAALAFLKHSTESTGTIYRDLVHREIISDFITSERLSHIAYRGNEILRKNLLSLGTSFLNPQTVRNLISHLPSKCNLFSSTR